MKKYLLAAVAAVALGVTAADAQMIECHDLFGTRYCNGSNGYHSQVSPNGAGGWNGFDNQGQTWGTQRWNDGSTHTYVNPGYGNRW